MTQHEDDRSRGPAPPGQWRPSWWALPLAFVVGLAVWFALSALLGDSPWDNVVQGVVVMAGVTLFLAWQLYRRK